MENGDVTDGIVPESVFLESSTDVYVHPDYYKRRHQSQRKRRNQRRAAKMSYAIAQEAVALAALVSAQNGSDLTEELEPQPGCSKQWTEPPVCDHNGKSNEEKAESGSEELSDSVFEAQVVPLADSHKSSSQSDDYQTAGSEDFDAIQQFNFVQRWVDQLSTFQSIRSLNSVGWSSNHVAKDFIELRQACLDAGTLFEDPDFETNDRSLYHSKLPARSHGWYRPGQICDDAKFHVTNQSFANLPLGEEFFARLMPLDNSFDENYAGIFHFRFWQHGKWDDVVIDDRLPFNSSQLRRMQTSGSNEFWILLLGKAQAKLHGSYEALIDSSVCERMEDFTGGITELYELKNAPADLYSIVQRSLERVSMIGCHVVVDSDVAVAVSKQGLVRGREYSVVKAQSVEIATPNRTLSVPLLRLRNPPEIKAEWNGLWCDNSPAWLYVSEDIRRDFEFSFQETGEFWMTYTDFLKYFDRIELCTLSPNSLNEEQAPKKGPLSMFEGEWTAGVSAGGCRNFLNSFWMNPQYVMTLKDPDDGDGLCTVIVSLIQKLPTNFNCLTIGFVIYHMSERDLAQTPLKLDFFRTNAMVAQSAVFINAREVGCRFKLKPGHYMIVPSTYEPNMEAAFIVRIFRVVPKPPKATLGMSYVDSQLHHVLPDYRLQGRERFQIEQMFMQVAGAEEQINWCGLQHILDTWMGAELLKMGASDGSNGALGSGLWELVCSLCRCTTLAELFGLSHPNRIRCSNTTLLRIRHVTESRGFSKDLCRSMVAMLDYEMSGLMGLENLLVLLNDIVKCMTVFKMFDPEDDHVITGDRLCEAFDAVGYHLDSNIGRALARRYAGTDSNIAFDDFLTIAIRLSTMIEVFRRQDGNDNYVAMFSLNDWIAKAMYS